MDFTINYLTTTTQPAPSGVIFIYTMIETYMVTKIYGNGFYIAINKEDEYGFSDTKPFFFFSSLFSTTAINGNGFTIYINGEEEYRFMELNPSFYTLFFYFF